MKTKTRRRSGAGSAVAEPEDAERHTDSPTAVAAEALRTGVMPSRGREDEIPGEGRKLQVGDVDDRQIDNAMVGDQTPGGSMPSPDQDRVDDIGRAYGVQDADNGELRATSEVLDKRDRKRGQTEPTDLPEE